MMNHPSDIVLLESDMHYVTFANVPMQIFKLQGHGDAEFCLELDALRLISSLFPSHESVLHLEGRPVKNFRSRVRSQTLKVSFRRNETIPDRSARQCFRRQLPCIQLHSILDMLDLLSPRLLTGVEFSTLGVLLKQMNASVFHLCQGLCLMLTGVTQSSQIMLLLRVLCPEELRRLWVASMTISIMWMLMAIK
jgi:hypothetical protein